MSRRFAIAIEVFLIASDSVIPGWTSVAVLEGGKNEVEDTAVVRESRKGLASVEIVDP